MYENELERNRLECESLKNSLELAQIKFANEMKNGLGEEIKKNINTPQPVKSRSLKFIFYKILKTFGFYDNTQR